MYIHQEIHEPLSSPHGWSSQAKWALSEGLEEYPLLINNLIDDQRWLIIDNDG